jgi:NTE family protein
MLQALYEHGIRPDLLVGTSAGAINAAFIASRAPTPSTAADLQQVWRGLGRSDVFPANPLTAGLGMLGLHGCSVPAGSLRRLVLRHLELDRLEDAPVELHVVAADALSGEEVLLSSDPALDAVVASAAIPGVFPAVPWDAQLLIDGGIVNNTPISHAVALGADRILVLQAIGPGPPGRARRGVWASGVTDMLRVITRRMKEDVARHADSVELMVIPAPRIDVMPIDFGHADELITAGLRSARRILEQTSHVVPVREAA